MRIRKYSRIARGFLLLIMVVCLIPIVWEYALSVEHSIQKKNLSNVLSGQQQESVDSIPEMESITAVQQTESAAPRMEEVVEAVEAAEQQPVMLDKFIELYPVNHEMVGWLSIPGTVIDYPVMQCEDNEYYLHHSFYGEEDKYGCLFVKDIADVNTPGTNFIIYGHNMKDGSMFGMLDEYGNEAFYDEHTTLEFDTLYEERTYEIMAVFRSQVYQEDEDVFKYYQFYQADTEEEFSRFYENVMTASLYETGVTAAYGDTFLMLSTCAYHEEDGRLVVVAKRV
ncbi:MAG: class B sortase [Bacillus sp. (in: Bacteria)]|nr:class B sortase [Bacillus sp. (in: firmicutes)]MCM1428014.1 class B sortase [Eubacterium sp.]